MILTNLFVTLESYLKAVEEKRIPRPDRCIRCGEAKVWFVGWYERFVNLLVGDGSRHRQKMQIRRCRCAKCKKSWGILPAFVYPHRQFGPETTQSVVTELFRDAEKGPGDFVGQDKLGPSDRTVRRHLAWLEANFDEAAIQSEILSLAPAFAISEIGSVRIVGGQKKIKSLGGQERADCVGRILGAVRAWHRAGRRHRRASDPCALRSYMRHLWDSAEGLVLYLTRPPQSTGCFIPAVAT